MVLQRGHFADLTCMAYVLIENNVVEAQSNNVDIIEALLDYLALYFTIMNTFCMSLRMNLKNSGNKKHSFPPGNIYNLKQT